MTANIPKRNSIGPPLSLFRLSRCRSATSGALYLGATSAFHKDIMRIFGPLRQKNTFEDLTLGFRAALEGRVSLINEPLVRYRPDIGISAQPKPISLADGINKRRKNLAFRVATLEQRYEDVAKSSCKDGRAVCKKISDDLIDKKLRLSFFRSHDRQKIPLGREPSANACLLGVGNEPAIEEAVTSITSSVSLEPPRLMAYRVKSCAAISIPKSTPWRAVSVSASD